MNVLISLIVIIISQCICILKHHVIHLKYIKLFVNFQKLPFDDVLKYSYLSPGKKKEEIVLGQKSAVRISAKPMCHSYAVTWRLSPLQVG